MHRAASWLLAILVMMASAPSWAASMKSIVKEKVNVRKGPGTNHEVLYQANVGFPIEVETKQGEWIGFKDWRGDRGWVQRSFVGDIKTVVILADDVNVRRGPGPRHTVVTKASQGEIYKVLEKKAGWVKLGYYFENEEVGWVREDLVWGN